MKKSLFLATLSVLAVGALFSIPAYGDRLAGPVEFKIMGGASLARSTKPIGGSYGATAVSKYGLGIISGAGIEFPLTKLLSFEIDVIFLQKTCRIYRLSIEGVLYGRRVEKLNEISMPFFYKLYLRRGTSPFILMGGEFAFVLPRDPKWFDDGLVFGLGFRKKAQGGSLSIEGRYHHGLQDTQTERSILRKMRTFALVAGFSF